MTAKRRPSDALAAFRRAGMGKPSVPVADELDAEIEVTAEGLGVELDETERLPAAAPSLPAERTSKFSMLFDQDGAAEFDELAAKLRRLVGRRVEKAVIVRALVGMAADDQTLMASLAEEIKRRNQA